MSSNQHFKSPQTKRLEQISVSGLGSMPSVEFLEISVSPFTDPLPPEQLFRIGVLRLIVFRQHHQLHAAHQEIRLLLIKKDNINVPIDDLFIFSCESMRTYLLIGKEDEALKSLLAAHILQSNVSKDLQDYLLIALFVIYSHMLDDQTQLKYVLQAKRTPDSNHPYHMAWNNLVLQQNINWSYALVGKMRTALENSEELLHVCRADIPNSASRKQMEIEFLLMKASIRRKVSRDDLDAAWKLINTQIYKQQSQIETSLSVAEALNAQNNNNHQAAHAWFQKALLIAKNHKGKDRVTLYCLDQAARYYKKHGLKDEYIQVLEQHSQLLTLLRKRTSNILSQLLPIATDLNQARHELATSRMEVVERLSAIGEWRDDATGQHTRRVAHLTHFLAKTLKLDNAIDIAEAARLHDLGKVAVPDSILLKRGPLDAQERKHMQLHTIFGEQMLSDSNSNVMKLAQIIALHHHERWDGQGYPAGLKGKQIPLAARIVAVADVFDALTNERPYKRAWSQVDALTEICSQSGKQFDPNVVKALEHVLKTKQTTHYTTNILNLDKHAAPIISS